MRVDITLKSIFLRSCPHLWAALGFERPVEFLTVEFPVKMKVIADLVALLPDGTILHLELQSRNEPMCWRLLLYYASLRLQWPDRRIRQVVLYVGADPMSIEDSCSEPDLSFRFLVRDMREFDSEVMLSSEVPSERVLAILCRNSDPRATIRRILESYGGLPDKEFGELISCLTILSHLRGADDILKEEQSRMPITLDLKKNAVLGPLFEQAEAEGVSKGLAQGISKGLEQGISKGMHDLLIQLIEQRFGPLPAWASERVRSAAPDQLQVWARRVLTANALDGVFS